MEEVYDSTDPIVLENPDIKELIKELRDEITPVTRTGHQLNLEEWRKGMEGIAREDYIQKIVQQNSIGEDGGWEVTENTELKAQGTDTGYKAPIRHWKAALQTIKDKVRKGYIWGPFDEGTKLPTGLTKGQQAVFWPIFFKDEVKPDGRVKTRLLTDFSYEGDGVSFNDEIRDAEKTVSYIMLIDVIRMIMECGTTWIWSLDALDAYYRVPIQARFIPRAGIKLCGMMFFFTCLVMGMASACKLYTEFADVITDIIVGNEKGLFLWKQKNQGAEEGTMKRLIMHYIDDFVGGHEDRDTAQRQFNKVKEWWDKLGVPTQDKKCTEPTTALRYLGFILYTIEKAVRVPKDRLQRYTTTLRKLRDMRKGRDGKGRKRKNKGAIDVRELQRAVGQFRSITPVYIYIVPAIRPMEEAVIRAVSKWKKKNPKQPIIPKGRISVRLTGRMERGWAIIEEALKDARTGTMPMKWLMHPRNAGDITVYTDAATKHGVGGYIHTEGGRYFSTLWEETRDWEKHGMSPDITYMELLGVVLAARLFSQKWGEKAIKFFCDNWAVCAIVTRKVACFRRPDLNDLVGELCRLATKYRFYFWIEHIKGEDNVLADALSRRKDIDREELEIELAEDVTPSRDETRDLLETWYRNMKEVVIERIRNKTKCECERERKGTRKLCDKCNEGFQMKGDIFFRNAK